MEATLNTNDMDNNLLKEVTEHIDAPMPPAIGIGALAMNFALKFCELNTISDGLMYQQLKLEGKNIGHGWHLDQVFDIARQIEIQLMSTPNRLTNIVFEQIAEGLEEELGKEESDDVAET